MNNLKSSETFAILIPSNNSANISLQLASARSSRHFHLDDRRLEAGRLYAIIRRADNLFRGSQRDG